VVRQLSQIEARLNNIIDNDLRHIRSDIKKVDDRVKWVERLTFVVIASIIASAIGVIVS
jgi:hypothetical protein